jgi:hypothetical protein
MLFFNTLYIIITLIFARPSQNYTVTGAPVFPFMSSMILLNSKIKNNIVFLPMQLQQQKMVQ